MGTGVLPRGQEGAVTEPREGAVGGDCTGAVALPPPGPSRSKASPSLLPCPHLSLASPTGRAQLSPRGQEAGSHEPPGTEKQGWRRRMAGSGAGRQRSAPLQGPSCARPPQVLQAQRTPGLGLRKLESVDQGVPGLASPSPRRAAPCPRGMCG